MKYLALLVLCGCSAVGPVSSTYGRDGQAALFVECVNSKSYCYEAAAHQCPAGYVPIGENEANTPTAVGSNGNVLMGNIYRASLTFRCK